MPILAEISDKMPTIGQMWALCFMLGLPLVMIAAIHRWAALAVWPPAVGLSALLTFAAYQQAYLDVPFSRQVWHEMGGAYVVHSFAAAMLPAAMVTIIVCVHWWYFWRITMKRGAAGHCSACGYNLRGVLSETCPECGQARQTV